MVEVSSVHTCMSQWGQEGGDIWNIIQHSLKLWKAKISLEPMLACGSCSPWRIFTSCWALRFLSLPLSQAFRRARISGGVNTYMIMCTFINCTDAKQQGQMSRSQLAGRRQVRGFLIHPSLMFILISHSLLLFCNQTAVVQVFKKNCSLRIFGDNKNS